MLITDEVLAALVAPVGPRAEAAALVAWLKLASDAELIVDSSELTFLDAHGSPLEVRRGAFGLSGGVRLVGPLSTSLADDRDRPAAAVLARWRLNEWCVETTMTMPEAAWRLPRAVYLPLQVPLAGDIHMIVSVVNNGDVPIDVAAAVREAVCWVDGAAYPSVAGGHWDGEHRLRPRRTRSLQFRLSDFPGAPREGMHEISVEIVGGRSSSERVRWRGEPWADPTA